jgi:hypothetical protein
MNKNTHNPKYDYHPETDDAPPGIKWIIIVAAIAFAIYLSFVVV